MFHLHFHGRCKDTVADFAELGIDCVCPFERPPGGDIDGEKGLQEVRELLAGRVTFNGNVHSQREILLVFAGFQERSNFSCSHFGTSPWFSAGLGQVPEKGTGGHLR